MLLIIEFNLDLTFPTPGCHADLLHITYYYPTVGSPVPGWIIMGFGEIFLAALGSLPSWS